MAIQFARCEYVSRSTGGNACRKASYNQRAVVHCERTGEVFSFKDRGGNIHHEILLPEGAHSKFKNSEALWNEAEKCEKRKDSQVAKEFVIALPDDQEITVEDRIELTRRFAQFIVEKGVAVQLDVHSPHEGEKNWHAHLLATTRRFSEDGLTFCEKKATDLDPIIRNGIVVEGDIWGEIWKVLQNTYFEEQGYNLKVDPIGIVPQEHLGPVRMRHHMNEALLRARLLQEANEKIASCPKSVLEEITRTRAVFSEKDVDFFLKKHVPFNEREGLLEKVMSSSGVLQLYDKDTGNATPCFTTEKVRSEEEKLLRFTDVIAKKPTFGLPPIFIEKGLEGKTLTNEQREAYDLCVSSGENLCIIQGRAGVGKSYLLDSIRMAHEASYFRVLGLAPTHKVSLDLKENGFKETKTCHSFLFAFKNGREKLNSNTLVIVDEAGMVGTELSIELFNVIKNSGAKLILVGDDRQLSSVERGGTFGFLAERYEAVEIREVRRQTINWQKSVSEDLSKGDIRSAVHLLQENKAIIWNEEKEVSMNALLKDWAKDSLLKSHETRQILAQKNIEVDALNQGVRDILRQQGKLGDLEVICSTTRGKTAFAEGDRVQFTKTDKGQDLRNGYFGVIEKIDPKTKILTIQLDNKGLKEVNPNTYDGLCHGYAATIYKAQGSTLSHVYVLHSKTTNQSTNYVALTRQTKSLSLYVSKNETPSELQLIHQMGREEGKSTSLVFNTLRDIQERQKENSFPTYFKQIAERFFTGVKDLFHKNEDFYKVNKTQSKSQEPARVSIFKHFPELKKTEENVFEKEGNSKITPPKGQPFIETKTVEEALKQNMAFFADHIFDSIGEPYHTVSSSSIERRHGKKGHIAVNLKTGAWINYKDSSLSGDPLHMLTKLKGLSFKEAVEYGAIWAGLERQKRELHLPPQRAEAGKEGTGKAFLPAIHVDGLLDVRSEEENKRIEKAQALWEKGVPIQGTLAERYLREHRKMEGELPKDLRYLPFFRVKEKDLGEVSETQAYPCLMAAVRSPEGRITAVQLTFLDSHTAFKANLDTPRKSFGVLKGLAVTVQEDKDSNIHFVAEGVETALSLKEAGLRGTIKATLGLSNLRHFVPQNSPHENSEAHIVVCADHDAPDSPAFRDLEKSVLELQDKGLNVTVIKPETVGEDFNDVLKKQGSQGVRDILKKSFPQQLSKVLSTNAGLDQNIFSNTPLKVSVPEIGFHEASRSKDDFQEMTSPDQKLESSFQEFDVKGKTFTEILGLCEKRLFSIFKADNGRTPRSEEIPELMSQVDKTADFILNQYALKGKNPTPEEVKLLSGRAGYEVDRIPELRQMIIDDWVSKGQFERNDELMAHLTAERLAAIEGRLMAEAKRQGLASPKNLLELAQKELNQHIDQVKKLTTELVKKYSLSEKAALICAQHHLRYQETYGENSSAGQMNNILQISQELEKRRVPLSKEGFNFQEIHFLIRKEGECLLRSLTLEGEMLSSIEFRQIQAQARSSLKEISSITIQDLERTGQELSRITQKELSL